MSIKLVSTKLIEHWAVVKSIKLMKLSIEPLSRRAKGRKVDG